MDQRIVKKIDPEFIPESLAIEQQKRNPQFETFCQEFVESKLLSPEQNPESIYKQKVDRKVLMLDKPEQQQQPLKVKIVKHLNRKQKLELLKLRKQDQQYSIFEPLNKLWNEYIISLLDGEFKQTDDHFARICKADYHGALLTITQSKCSTNIGISGIVVKDAKNTFQLITKKNELKLIPKAHTNFRITIDGVNLVLFGNQLRTRPADRISKKLKNHHSIAL